MASPPREPLPQRKLAIELRYRIDVAMLAEERRDVGIAMSGTQVGVVAPISQSIQRVRELVDEHPQGMLSKHVQHNLGPDRMAWLKEKELIR